MCEYKSAERYAHFSKTGYKSLAGAKGFALTSVKKRRPVGSVEGSSQRISVSPLPTTSSDEGAYDGPSTYDPALSSGKRASAEVPWNDLHGQGDGEVARWAGIDVATQFPGLVLTQNPWNSPWTATSGSLGSPGLPVSEDVGTSQPGSVHDTISLLQGTQSLPSRFTSTGWHPEKTDDLISWLMTFDVSTSYNEHWPVAGTAEELTHLPVAQTKQNTDLLRICTFTLPRQLKRSIYEWG